MIKCNILSKAEKKMILENKKAGQNGMDFVLLRGKLDLCVLSVLFNNCLCDRINYKLKNVLKRKFLILKKNTLLVDSM